MFYLANYIFKYLNQYLYLISVFIYLCLNILSIQQLCLAIYQDLHMLCILPLFEGLFITVLYANTIHCNIKKNKNVISTFFFLSCPFFLKSCHLDRGLWAPSTGRLTCPLCPPAPYLGSQTGRLIKFVSVCCPPSSPHVAKSWASKTSELDYWPANVERPVTERAVDHRWVRARLWYIDAKPPSAVLETISDAILCRRKQKKHSARHLSRMSEQQKRTSSSRYLAFKIINDAIQIR